MNGLWKKLGLLYEPDSANSHPKLVSHAANPLAVHLEADVYRIFFSGRDVNNKSSVGAVDIDIVKRKVVQKYPEPFFIHGAEGSFYADGVSIGNCYEVDGITYMLFMGWQNPVNSHWRGDIGRLIVKPDMTLQLDTEIPFLGIDTVDPISLSYPWVLKDEVEGYKMWYGSTITWDAGNGEMLHVINYASSFDGHHWHRQGLCVPYEINKAQAFSRPTVIGNSYQGYQMWFSYRSGLGEKYRIGYAVSQNGINWELALKSSGINISNQGWDSEMIEYPFVFNHKGKHYMLYNGNGYGKTGFGLAIMEEININV
ncbi:hypothetical protein IQ227_19810 [Anabaena aphanizomenioides LEGE 00250]|uniref:Glycosyl hydrolase family 32 N-terminal domain-containing protein n=1 Tax=Sphaerospermopsis aphanizomenoides LEGE 00250 TaxID=2777972 RepID=A0ABR9VI82_9CYAN|nr:hypothetical protein [Sphaerospermopsis aphanizomenoides]MBE9238210.1 hypothetical protein [Sphaerospermopsis aphanizomenoides LEGE 00250]